MHGLAPNPTHCSDNTPLLTMPVLSKVRIYKPEELDVNVIRQQSHIKLKTKPFDWQLQVPLSVYCHGSPSRRLRWYT